jgi:hypothetical protein
MGLFRPAFFRLWHYRVAKIKVCKQAPVGTPSPTLPDDINSRLLPKDAATARYLLEMRSEVTENMISPTQWWSTAKIFMMKAGRRRNYCRTG